MEPLTTTTDGITIIPLVPRFDAASAPDVEAMIRAIPPEKMHRVIFDFTGTTYIASAGLRVMLSASRVILRGGGTVALCSLAPQVRQVFEIAGFTKIFTICGTRDEALALLRK